MKLLMKVLAEIGERKRKEGRRKRGRWREERGG